jgi:hypothetical protein
MAREAPTPPRYELRPGKHLPKGTDVTTVAARIEQLKTAHGGAVTPHRVLEDATDAASPLHNCFTWDDTEAARKHRLNEARRLVTCYYVTHVERKDAPPRMIVSNVSIRSHVGERHYVSSSRALTEADVRRQTVAEIDRMLNSVLDRYMHLPGIRSELAEALKRAQQRLNGGNAA